MLPTNWRRWTQKCGLAYIFERKVLFAFQRRQQYYFTGRIRDTWKCVVCLPQFNIFLISRCAAYWDRPSRYWTRLPQPLIGSALQIIPITRHLMQPIPFQRRSKSHIRSEYTDLTRKANKRRSVCLFLDYSKAWTRGEVWRLQEEFLVSKVFCLFRNRKYTWDQ